MADVKALDNYQNYRYCYENGHNEWVQLAALCFNFWRGRQWRDADILRCIKARRPHLTLNVIESLVRSMKGIQRALRNDVRFMPVQDADMNDAQVHDAIWMHVQQQNDLDFLETDMYERGLITGRAYWRYGVDFDENTQGQIWVKTPRSQDVVQDPVVNGYGASDWPQVYYAPWMSKQEIEHEFGEHAARELAATGIPEWYGMEDRMMAQRVGALPYYHFTADDTDRVRAFRLLIRQYQDLKMKDVFVDTKTGETCEIPATWDRERVGKVLEDHHDLSTTKRKIKIIRVVTTCEDLVLKEEDSIYKNYDLVPFYPTFLDGVSMGAVESLVGPQELFNKVTSQELHIINATSNGGFKNKKGNLKGMTKEEFQEQSAQPGFYVELDDPSQLEKIVPNPVPQGHEKMSFKADTIMRSLAGVSNQSRGFAREDVANEAILSNQAASDTNFSSWLANLHRTKKALATCIQDCAKDFYTETRVIMINRGSAYRPEMDSVTINQPTPEGDVMNDITAGKFTTMLIPSPTRASLSEGEFKDLVMLRKDLGIQIPDDVMIEQSSVSNKMQIIQRMKGDSNEAQQAKAKAEQQQAELDHQETMAKIRKEHGAADLNEARAEKFRGEAGRDPDAAYERVEMTRIHVDQAASEDRLKFDYDKLRKESEDRKHNTALELTKLDHTANESAKDRRADLTKTHMQGMQRKQTTPSKTKGAK